MLDILLATRNPGKRVELLELLGDLPVNILIAEDVGLSTMDVDEIGTTLYENAALKCQAYARASGLWTLADDSGLFVDALDGLPGVDTANYGGPVRLLAALKDVPEPRTARFECVIMLCRPDGSIEAHVTGVCTGRIGTELRGAGGFGQDPVFIPEGYTETFAELGHAVKNPISHRGRAVTLILPALRGVVESAG
jgi:XTP/dITP diphosphohydrolase